MTYQRITLSELSQHLRPVLKAAYDGAVAMWRATGRDAEVSLREGRIVTQYTMPVATMPLGPSLRICCWFNYPNFDLIAEVVAQKILDGDHQYNGIEWGRYV